MRLHLAEVPALFWVALAGREARARLRFILASREQAAREALKAQVGRDVEAGRRAGLAEPGAFGILLELRRSRKAAEYALTGAAEAAGLAYALKPPECLVCKQRGCGLFHSPLSPR